MRENKWLGWYWVKWGIAVFLKLCFDGGFIFFGPVMLILNWLKVVSIQADMATNAESGIYMCCIISCFCIVDLVATVLVPWVGGWGRDLPVYMEDWERWYDYKWAHLDYDKEMWEKDNKKLIEISKPPKEPT